MSKIKMVRYRLGLYGAEHSKCNHVVVVVVVVVVERTD